MLESLVSGGDYLTERIVFCVAVFTAAAVGSWLLQMPIRKLLAECEQVLLDRMVKCGLDYEAKRPKAHVEGMTLGAILCEVKLYPNRSQDSRAVKRAVLPALIDYLQEHDALADIQVRETQ